MADEDEKRYTYWSEQELGYIRRAFPHMTTKEIAEKLHRSPASVACKACKMGLLRRKSVPQPKWTPEQEQYLRDHYLEQSDEEMASLVGHTAAAVKRRRNMLGLKTKERSQFQAWTKEEEEKLTDLFGERPLSDIAKLLKRSVASVSLKARRLGHLGQMRTGGMMSCRDAARIMGVDSHAITQVWHKKYGLRIQKKAVQGGGQSKRHFNIILFDDFLAWLKDHQDLWDSRRVELYALGLEYDWLTEKRNADRDKPPSGCIRWTAQEDDRLLLLFRQGDYTYQEIADRLGKTKAAVAHRLSKLNGAKAGKKGQPSEAFQRACLVAQLQRVLLLHRNSMGYGEYWQREICWHWDDLKGCTANQLNCDSCTEFLRIQPQICCRCGKTFFEKREERFCAACRKARLQRAQRRYARGSRPGKAAAHPMAGK